MLKLKGTNAITFILCMALIVLALTPAMATDLPWDEQVRMEQKPKEMAGDEIKAVEGVQPELYQGEGIKILINNKLVQTDVAPFIEEGRTLIPLRSVMEELGLSVTWEEESRAMRW
jgi:hypothetical protein